MYREVTPNLGAHYGLTTQIGRKLLEAGNLRGSEGLLQQAWKEAPDVASAPALLGVLYSQLGDVERTEHALKLQPGNGVSHHLMSWALSEQGRWAEPADARRRVIELGEDVWQPWTWLADLQARAGDSDAARAAQQTAHEPAGTDKERARIDSLAMQLTPVDSIGADSTESSPW